MIRAFLASLLLTFIFVNHTHASDNDDEADYWRNRGFDFYMRDQYVEAKRCYEKGAIHGDLMSQQQLGKFYKKGLGVTQDYLKAKAWFKKVAAQDSYFSDEAQYELGMLYKDGLGVTQDYLKAKKYFEKALTHSFENGKSARGYAQYELGMLYKEGLGVSQDYFKAKEIFERAKDMGVRVLPPTPTVAARLREIDTEIARMQSEKAALKSFKHLSLRDGEEKSRSSATYKAQVPENPEAQYERGLSFYNKQQYAQSKPFFEAAAAQGYSNAEVCLGHLYYSGCGATQDFSIAITWYEKAAAHGNEEALRLYIKTIDQHGSVEAKKRFSQSVLRACSSLAGQGHPGANFSIAKIYDHGMGVVSDLAKAESHYLRAAEAGHAGAQFSLSLLYDEGGRGVTRDPNRSFQYLKMAADSGHAEAQCNLGIRYLRSGGDRAQQDRTGASYLKLAADKGDAKGLYNLGKLYILNRGVNGRNDAEAIRLMRLAADKGHEMAKEALNGICRTNQHLKPYPPGCIENSYVTRLGIRSGSWIDNIELFGTRDGRSEILVGKAGGNGGEQYYIDLNGGDRISALSIGDANVHGLTCGITVFFNSGQQRQFGTGLRRGGESSLKRPNIVLKSDEQIKGFFGSLNDGYVCSLGVITNKREYGPFGGSAGGIFRFQIDSGDCEAE